MLRTIYRFSLGTVRSNLQECPRQSKCQVLQAKGGKYTLPAALLTVQRKFALALMTTSTTTARTINLTRNYAFLKNTFCTLHDNLLCYEPSPFSKPSVLFFFVNCSANITTLHVVPIAFPFH